MTENVGTRYLFDKNETGLTLEDNLISTLDWDISKRGHLQAFEYAGGNYIKLTHIPKGIKVYWNTKNDRAGAMLLDDVNRGVKVSKQNKWGQLMAYRNYYLWSEGTLYPDETNPHIILEFTGKGVEVEYLVGSATEIQLLADQFNTLNKQLSEMVESLANIQVSSSAIATANSLIIEFPADFSLNVSTNQYLLNLFPAQFLPTVTITNHFNHYHINFLFPASQRPTAALAKQFMNILSQFLGSSYGQLKVQCNYDIEYTIGLICNIETIYNASSGEVLLDECFLGASVKAIQSLSPNDVDFNFYPAFTFESTQSTGAAYSIKGNKYMYSQGGSVSGIRLVKNQLNYVGASLCNIYNQTTRGEVTYTWAFNNAHWIATNRGSLASTVINCDCSVDIVIQADKILK